MATFGPIADFPDQNILFINIQGIIPALTN